MSGKRTALLVGINNYTNSRGRAKDLQGCVNDVVEMQRLLRGEFGFDTGDPLVDGDATRTNILASLTTLVGKAAAGDVLVFYFAGHGSSTPVERDNRWTRQEIICPVDVESSGAFWTHHISDDDLLGILRGTPKGVSVEVVLDSCYATGMAVPGPLPGAAPATGRGRPRFWQPGDPEPGQPDVPDPAAGFAACASCRARRRTALGGQYVLWGAAGAQAEEDEVGGRWIGLFTHQFCKLVGDAPKITRARLNQELAKELAQGPGLHSSPGNADDPVFSPMC